MPDSQRHILGLSRQQSLAPSGTNDKIHCLYHRSRLRHAPMLDLTRLQDALNESVDEFADQMADLMRQYAAATKSATKPATKPSPTHAKPVTPSSRTVHVKPAKTVEQPPLPAPVIIRRPAAAHRTQAVRTAPKPGPVPTTAAPTIVVSNLGRRMLQLVGSHPDGISANDIADRLRTGLVPVFEGLRDLEAAGLLVRVVRGPDQLPVYAPASRS